MQIILWSKYHCNYCDQARILLKSKDITFEERKIGDGWTKEELLAEVPQAKTLPQIIIEGHAIGGFTELKRYLTEVYNG
jgi:glutaredoxin